MNPCAIIDPRLPEGIVKNLQKSGFSTIAAPLTELVDTPLSGHPDIQMFIHKDDIFVHPDIDPAFLTKIERYVNIIPCSTKLEKIYPGDIPYNIACTGITAFHKNGSTDKTIANYLLKNKINIFDTKQGYSKCSTLIVDDNSIITSDKSINLTAVNAGLDSLLISEGYIDLPGYNHGFIGGASGRFLDTIYLTGYINHHPDMESIQHFFEKKGMHINILSDQKIFDAGSIFFIS